MSTWVVCGPIATCGGEIKQPTKHTTVVTQWIYLYLHPSHRFLFHLPDLCWVVMFLPDFIVYSAIFRIFNMLFKEMWQCCGYWRQDCLSPRIRQDTVIVTINFLKQTYWFLVLLTQLCTIRDTPGTKFMHLLSSTVYKNCNWQLTGVLQESNLPLPTPCLLLTNGHVFAQMYN